MMPRRFSRRRMWILAAMGLVLLAIFLPPFVNVNRYRNRVTRSISNATGREVSASSVQLRLLPRPAMVLSTFVVASEPSYGVEPMLRADTVTAYLRLSSLWRGRLEIATLSLENPSLNLVRRADGHWNLEDLVQRSSQVPSAPTARARPEVRLRFPYVEATSGRINFKFEKVKKAFAFSDADFALWLQPENEWGIRLEARPVRSDVPVSDTGTLRLEGKFQRATNLRNTPLALKIDFAKGQLGQISTLIYGRDRGWRGGVTSSASLAGTPAAASVVLDASVDDFRRYDIALGQALRLSIHCTGTYSSIDDSVRAIQCQSPVRPGMLLVRGDLMGWTGQAYNLGISADQVPLDRVVALARHTKKDLPEDLTATGSGEAQFTVRKDAGGSAFWSGGGRATQLTLQSRVLKQDLEIGEVDFSVAPSAESKPGKRALRGARDSDSSHRGSSPRLVLTPFSLPLGSTSPAAVRGYFDFHQYQITLSGRAELTRLLNVARAMGVGAPAIGLAGPAQIDLKISGAWTGFAPPTPSGTIQLRDATAELRGILEPLQIEAATATLANQVVTVNGFTSEFKEGPLVSGSATFPLRCPSPGTCVLHFDLHTPEISLQRVTQLLNPVFQRQPWYRLLELGQQGDNALLKLRAEGRISATHAVIGSLSATNLVSTIEMHAGMLSVKALNADLLGGHHIGNWDADFTTQPPKFFGSGRITKLAMSQLGVLMHDPWATGTLGGEYTLGLTGLDPASIRNSTNGSASFKWSEGSLRHVTLGDRHAPLSFSSFGGQIMIKNGLLSCQECSLQSGGQLYEVKGTASFTRNLDLRLEGPGDTAYAVSGPLEKPRVEMAPVPTPEAKLH